MMKLDGTKIGKTFICINCSGPEEEENEEEPIWLRCFNCLGSGIDDRTLQLCNICGGLGWRN